MPFTNISNMIGQIKDIADSYVVNDYIFVARNRRYCVVMGWLSGIPDNQPIPVRVPVALTPWTEKW